LRGRVFQAEWRNEGLTGNYLFELKAGVPVFYGCGLAAGALT